MLLLSDDVADVKGPTHAGQYPEDAEGQLADLAAKLEAEGHAGILCEVDDAPVGKARHFTQGVIELDVELDHLIDDEHQKDGDEWYPVASEHFNQLAKIGI